MKVLSPFPYYGGKAKMCPLICSMLDYDNTFRYIEPFGGGCRTLLNKRKHAEEIYNDAGYGLVSFMNVMQNPEETEKLIDMLFHQPPSKELFDKLVIERMEIEDKLNTSTKARLSSLAWEGYKLSRHPLFQKLRSDLKKEKYPEIIQDIKDIMEYSGAFCLSNMEYQQYSHYLELYQDFWGYIEDEYSSTYEELGEMFDVAWENAGFSPKVKAKEAKKRMFIEENIKTVANGFVKDIINSNEKGLLVSDVEIAYNIFILYFSSRDGMGVAYSNEKNKNKKVYYKAVANLRNISKRMREVVITEVDAIDLIGIYRTDELAMLYLDPSYLKPEDEQKNLGEVYKMSYEYQDHEKLLQEITKPDTKARILISNYDVELYNEYLCGWKKTYYKTFTGVGGKKGNRRLEVLWQNY